MKKVIRLTENDIHRIVKESVKNILREAKIEDWGQDDFITWDDYQYYCNHDYDWVEKNEKRSDKLGVPKDERCAFCQRPVKKYKTLYGQPMEYPYYGKPASDRTDQYKIGQTCAKAVEAAHKKKYGR